MRQVGEDRMMAEGVRDVETCSPREPRDEVVGIAEGESKAVGGHENNLFSRLFTRSDAVWIAARWLLIGVCTLAAFWPSAIRTVDGLRGGDPLGYIFMMPFLAVMAAVGIARRRADELPIHDRQIDSVVGGMGLCLAVALQWLLVPRYAEQFSLLRIDLLVCLLFVMSSAVLMFGLRPVGRFWPVWLMLVVFAPLPYRMMVVALGGQSFHVAIVLTCFAAAATGIAVGRTRRFAAIGVVATFVVGIATLAVLTILFPDARRLVVQLVPPVVATVGVGIGMYLRYGHHTSDRGPVSSGAPQRSPAVTSGLVRSGLTVVAVAAVLNLIPLPESQATVPATGPGATARLAIPGGWTSTDFPEFDWAGKFFGKNARLSREMLVAREGVPEWDAQSRPRRVMVDVLDTGRPASLEVYPATAIYRMTQTRRSPVVPVDLGHGVQGELSTVVDEGELLTWSMLTFTWTRGEIVQRINLITVDDHRPDARFPEPTSSMASDVTNTLKILLRGNAVTIDESPQYKDREMLGVLGAALVDAQWRAEGS